MSNDDIYNDIWQLNNDDIYNDIWQLNNDDIYNEIWGVEQWWYLWNMNRRIYPCPPICFDNFSY